MLTMISDDTLAEAAEWLYETYEYGYGEYKDGVSLTILLEMQDSGIYGLAGSDSWCVYVSLNETLGSGQELANAVHDAVQPYMAPELWSGGGHKHQRRRSYTGGGRHGGGCGGLYPSQLPA